MGRSATLIVVLMAAESAVAVPSAVFNGALDAGDLANTEDDFLFSSPEVQRVRASINSRPGPDSTKATVLNRIALQGSSCFARTGNGTESPVSFVAHEPGMLIYPNERDLDGDGKVSPWEEKVHVRLEENMDQDSFLRMTTVHMILRESAKDTPEVKQWIDSGNSTKMLDVIPLQNNRLESPGSTDYVLDHVDAYPKQGSLHPMTADADAKELFEQLIAKTRLDNIPFHKVSIVAKAPEYGAGSLVHMLIYPLLRAAIDGRVLFAPQLRLWAPKDCDAQDLTCYFSSLPALSDYYVDAQAKMLRKRKPAHTDGVSAQGVETRESTIMAEWRALEQQAFAKEVADSVTDEEVAEMDIHEEKLDIHNLDMNWLQKKEAHIETPVERLLRLACNSTKADDTWKDFSTDQCGIRSLHLRLHQFYKFEETELFSRLGRRFVRHGRFWLVSQVLHFLTRPNDQLKQQLDEQRAAMRMSPSYLSLHVRKGDACTARGDCRDLKYYMPHIQRMSAKYGLKSVFLSTPSQSVLDETKNYPDINFAYLPVSSATQAMRDHHIKQLEEGLGKGVINAGTEFRHYMVDMYLLSEGSAFLGAFTSNAARLAFSMMSSGTEGCLKPYQSTDINWCFAFGKIGSGVIRHNNISCADDPHCHKLGYDQYGC